MAIPIQCPECHKKYQAPDHMAGKRVKCKYCGVIFLIAADARTADAALDMSAIDELNALADPAKRKAGGGGAAGAGAGAAAAGAGGDDIDSIFQCDYPSDGAPRTNKLYVFPMSRLLDRWLPPVLLAIGLIWVLSEAYQRNDTDRAWVGVFRGALFLLAFFASVYPFTFMGIRAASCRLNYELPPRPGLRIMGVFAVPFALACAMWLVLGGVSGFLIGTLIGCVIALPVLFLLFRLLPREAPITFGYATGSFLLSLVVSAAAVFALNLMLVGALRAMKSEQTLAASPFGPEFKWDAPAERARAQLARNPPPDEPDPAAEIVPDTAPATGGESTDGEPTDVATTAPSTPSTRTAVAGGTEMTGPSEPTQRDVVHPADGTAGAGNTSVRDTEPTANGNGNGGDEEKPKPVEVARGFVSETRVVVPGAFRQVVYPAVPGPRLAVVREGRLPGHDRVEVWDTAEWKKVAELDVPRTPQGNRYALSADGQLLSYVTDFPRLTVQVWSVEAGRRHREIELDPADGGTEVIGFASADQLVLRRRPQGQFSLQVLNAKTGGRPRMVPVPEFELDPARYALSPDGSAVAFIVRSNRGADLESYSLLNGRPIKQMPIDEVNWADNVRVAGLAFSPDGQRIAAVIADGRGAGFIGAWPAAGRSGQAVLQKLLPVGVDLPPPHHAFGAPAFEGRPFHWLDGGRAWLLFGASVFDTDTGTLLGSTKLPQVRSQSTRPDGNAAHLLASDEFGSPHLFEVRLDLEGARKRLISRPQDAPAVPR